MAPEPPIREDAALIQQVVAAAVVLNRLLDKLASAGIEYEVALLNMRTFADRGKQQRVMVSHFRRVQHWNELVSAWRDGDE